MSRPAPSASPWCDERQRDCWPPAVLWPDRAARTRSPPSARTLESAIHPLPRVATDRPGAPFLRFRVRGATFVRSLHSGHAAPVHRAGRACPIASTFCFHTLDISQPYPPKLCTLATEGLKHKEGLGLPDFRSWCPSSRLGQLGNGGDSPLPHRLERASKGRSDNAYAPTGGEVRKHVFQDVDWHLVTGRTD